MPLFLPQTSLKSESENISGGGISPSRSGVVWLPNSGNKLEENTLYQNQRIYLANMMRIMWLKVRSSTYNVTSFKLNLNHWIYLINSVRIMLDYFHTMLDHSHIVLSHSHRMLNHSHIVRLSVCYHYPSTLDNLSTIHKSGEWWWWLLVHKFIVILFNHWKYLPLDSFLLDVWNLLSLLHLYKGTNKAFFGRQVK